MKKLLIALAVLNLNGCALIDAYLMAGYDTNEYSLVNKIKTKSEIYVDDCKDVTKSKQIGRAHV